MQFKIFESQSISILIVGLLVWLSTYLDRFFLLGYSTSIQQATYQVTYQIASLIGLILAQLSTLNALKILKSSNEVVLKNTVRKLTIEYIVLATILFFPILLFQQIFFTAKYEMSIPLFSALFVSQAIGGLASLYFSISTLNFLQFKSNYIFFGMQLIISSGLLSALVSRKSLQIDSLAQVSCIASGIALLSFITVLNRYTDFLDVSIFNYIEIGILLTYVCALSYLHNTLIFIGVCTVTVYILLRFREVSSNSFPRLFKTHFFRKFKN